jgi:hypothetical protein
MDLPQYFNLARLAAQISALLGGIYGMVALFSALKMFRLGFWMGLLSVAQAVWIIVLSLASLGLVYAFLALVQAQIETRNAVVDYINQQGRGRTGF